MWLLEFIIYRDDFFKIRKKSPVLILYPNIVTFALCTFWILEIFYAIFRDLIWNLNCFFLFHGTFPTFMLGSTTTTCRSTLQFWKVCVCDAENGCCKILQRFASVIKTTKNQLFLFTTFSFAYCKIAAYRISSGFHEKCSH